MNYFWNFGTPSISRELFELKTTNSARRLTSGGTNHKNEKIRSKVVGRGSRGLLLDLCSPPYLGNGLSYKLQIWHAD